MKKMISILLTIMLLLVAFSACTGSTPAGNDAPDPTKAASAPEKPEDITLRVSWWGPEARHQATLEVMEMYEKLNSHVKLQGEYGDWNGWYDKLLTQIAGGTAPDVMQVNDRWYYDFTSNKQVVIDMNTLTDYVDLTTFDKNFLDTYCSYNGILLGVPLGVNGTGMLYNKDFFAKYGIPEDTVWTWDNLMEIGIEVHKKDSNAYLLCSDPNEMMTLMRAYIKQKIGTQLIADDYTFNLSKELLTEVFQYTVDLLDNGVAEPFESAVLYTNVSNENPKWIRGELGMQFKYLSLLPRYLESDLNLGIVTLPVMEGLKDTGVLISTGNLMSVYSGTKHVEECAKFINWFVNDKDAILTLGEVRGIPATDFARKTLSEAGKGNTFVSDAVNIALENASNIVENGLSQNQEFEALLIDTFEQVGFKRLTPEEAANFLYDTMIEKLEELKSQN
ncbi:MAG TPA: extracellular solute-binding protein [Clostridiaceae bacterium]|nr:extracellular solute-binding protein [Clostridiaceae bacterium]